MLAFEDPDHEGNSPTYHTGRKCVEPGCEGSAGTRWSPLWCFACNVRRMKRISRQLKDIKKGVNDMNNQNAANTEAQHTPGYCHTPEPWGLEEAGYICGAGVLVASANCSQEIDIDEREANARRIVACVNACAGISTEALEAGVMSELLSAVRTALIHVQLRGSGQPSLNSNGEMCTLLGDLINKAEGRSRECICETGEWSGMPNPENPANEWICDTCGRIIIAEGE